MPAHGGPSWSLLVAPVRQSLLSAGEEGFFRGDELRTSQGRVVGRHASVVDRALFWGDAEHVVALDRKGSLRIWDVRSGRARVLRERGPALLSLAVLPAAGLIAVGCRKDHIEVWSV